MDGDGQGANGTNGANGALNGEGKRKGRKYYVGDDGVGVWRAGMEVDNFMLDGVGESRRHNA
jgi:actin-like protein 6A